MNTITYKVDNPVLHTTEELLDRSLPRPTVRQELVGELLQVLKEGLGDLGGHKRPLWISKARFGEANLCKSFAVARSTKQFSWSQPAALGSIVDRAITVGLEKRRLSPKACVESALSGIELEGTDLARFLDTLGPEAKELLSGKAVELVGNLLECWPHFPPDNFDSQVVMKVYLSGAVVLRGTPDLVLGSLASQDGCSRALVLDWKTGQLRPEHALEQRFYALLTTLWAGRPPWRVATYYLSTQRCLIDEVSEELLFSTAAQVVEVAHLLNNAAFSEQLMDYSPGEYCAWCPTSSECPKDQGTLSPEPPLGTGQLRGDLLLAADSLVKSLFSITEVGLALFEATVEVLLGGGKRTKEGAKG